MAAHHEPITHQRIRYLLSYAPDTGIFTTAASRKGSPSKVGDRVGTYVPKDDSLIVSLDNRTYPLHNLAWFWVHGEWPAKQLVKLDGNGRNTAISNLALPVSSARGEITHARLQSLLNYDRNTGVFRWKVRAAKNLRIGDIAGHVDKNTLNHIISVDGIDYTAQRLAWLYEYGELPDRTLRFLDGDQTNLAITNIALPEFDARTPEGNKEYRRVYRSRSFEVLRNSDLRKSFGAGSPDVYRLLFVAQKGLCAGCNRPERAARNGKVKWLALDHCHETNMIRGLLCADCNTTLGKMDDDPVRLRQLADYLETNHDVTVDGNVVRFVKKGPS